MDRPKVKQADGNTTIDTVVNLDYGFALRTVSQITKEYRMFDRKAYIATETHQAELKNCMDLIALGVYSGLKVEVMVEGEDQRSETLALRVYSALTCRDSYDLDFNRFNEEV